LYSQFYKRTANRVTMVAARHEKGAFAPLIRTSSQTCCPVDKRAETASTMLWLTWLAMGKPLLYALIHVAALLAVVPKLANASSTSAAATAHLLFGMQSSGILVQKLKSVPI